jgi:hypothetical protein
MQTIPFAARCLPRPASNLLRGWQLAPTIQAKDIHFETLPYCQVDKQSLLCSPILLEAKEGAQDFILKVGMQRLNRLRHVAVICQTDQSMTVVVHINHKARPQLCGHVHA